MPPNLSSKKTNTVMVVIGPTTAAPNTATVANPPVSILVAAAWVADFAAAEVEEMDSAMDVARLEAEQAPEVSQ